MFIGQSQLAMCSTTGQDMIVPETDHGLTMIEKLLQIAVDDLFYNWSKLINISTFPVSEIQLFIFREKILLVLGRIEYRPGKLLFQKVGDVSPPGPSPIWSSFDGSRQVYFQ